nr:MAG TPA: hypothetical protein [Caudoviricetes sp.]DAX26581.1 MAG TPA: hypothetical protein [Caudoviricetes sp.]DAY03632.1 MAG TPA: hypothetical protein [Caudoviricetes sp.]
MEGGSLGSNRTSNELSYACGGDFHPLKAGF